MATWSTGYSGAWDGTEPPTRFKLDFTGSISGTTFTGTVKATASMRWTSSWWDETWSGYVNKDGSRLASGTYSGGTQHHGQSEFSWTSGTISISNLPVNGSNVSFVTGFTAPSGGRAQTLSLSFGALYQEPSQKYLTSSKDTTINNESSSGSQGHSYDTFSVSGTNGYVGDSFTYTWKRTDSSSTGYSADPKSTALLVRDSDNTNDSSYSTKLYTAWEDDTGSTDKDITYTRTATTDDYGKYLQARIWKYWKNSSGTQQTKIQSNAHLIKSKPTLTATAELRSRKFYKNTASAFAWQWSNVSLTSNGYGTLGYPSNNSGYTGSTSVGSAVIFNDNRNSTGQYTAVGNHNFNGNYSASTVFNKYTNMINHSSWGTGTYTSYLRSYIYNPNTGSTSSIDTVNGYSVTYQVVDGSISLAKIDSIVPISGNGTTVISGNNIYSTETNAKITYRVNHSGNTNGFGYDARVYETGYTAGGNDITTLRDTLWNGNYGSINNTSDTFTIQHDGLNASASARRACVIPYITDGNGFKIFGDSSGKTFVTSDSYNMYKISKPGTPTITTWTNTLPAIDGIKDNIQYAVTAPSSWGNVTDFTKGYKLRYEIGNDTTHQDGSEWKYISDSGNISGTITETYNRSAYTSASLKVAATSYLGTTWNSYPDFQSSFTNASTFAITAQTPYTAAAGTVTCPTTALNSNAIVKYKPANGTMNGNKLIQSLKVIIDGVTEVEMPTPTYTMTTPNSRTGMLTVSFNQVQVALPALSRGTHTIQVQHEVSTYFESTTPANNVYFDTHLNTTTAQNIEIGDLPLPPVSTSVSPAYVYAGADRTLTFNFSASDWGCTDTTTNDRKFKYRILDNNDNIVTSSTLSKTATSDVLNYMFISPEHDGGWKYQIAQSTILGDSSYVDIPFEVLPAVEPEESNIIATNIIALADWNWLLKIIPGNNGTYQLANLGCRYKVELYQGETFSREILSWTSVPNNTNVNRSFTTSLNGCEDGTYKVIVTYERHYTTGKVKTAVGKFDVIPPEVELYNESEITSISPTSDNIGFKISLRSFAATMTSHAWYSMDYGHTWTALTQTSTSGANKIYEKDLTLSWLDVIYLKMSGTNPVDSKEQTFIVEMPSDYKTWLSWANSTSTTNPDVIRRWFMSRNGGNTYKARHITKH